MILQHMIWADKENKEITELYYHTKIPVNASGQRMMLSAGTTVQFDTYYNAFLAETWKRYTNIEEVAFRVIVEGTGTVTLMGEGAVPLKIKKFCGKQELVFFAALSESLYFYLEVQAEEETILERGMIECVSVAEATSERNTEKSSRIRTVKMALVICTYNRQKEIQRNIKLLKNCNRELENGEVILEQIYVVDNANNLKKSEIEGKRVSLIPNQNTGGSGGFTRGMREAMKRMDLSHIILMDDDVHIEFETFWRTKAFLSYIKREYEENFLGGAMFRMDIPYVLHAAGEDWADGYIRNPYKSTDMRKFKQVIHVSKPVETKQAYAGWWYCCIPRSHVIKKDYPMPFFLHCDDVEYALRSGKPPLYLNGVAVWHEEFEDKRSSVMEYYDVRNRLITNAIYKEHGKLRDAIYILCERFYATVFRYRYKDFVLSVKAAEDFLKGPEWLKSVDSEQLHKSLLKYGYVMKDVQELPKTLKYPVKSRVVTIGRYFFPASGSDVIRIGAPVSAYTGKKKVLLVEPKSKKGFEVEKLWMETVRCTGQFIRFFLKLILQYKKSERAWLQGIEIRNKTYEVDKNIV